MSILGLDELGVAFAFGMIFGKDVICFLMSTFGDEISRAFRKEAANISALTLTDGIVDLQDESHLNK